MPGQFTPLRTNWMTPLDSEVVDWEAALRGRLLYEEQTWTLPDLQEPVSDQVSWPPSLEHGTVIQPGEPCVSERYPIASPSQLGPDQRSSSDVGGSAASTSTSGRYYVDGAEARAPFRGMSNLGSSALTYAIGRRESTSLWPSGAEVVSATEPTSPANRPFVSDYAYGKMSDVLRCVARKQSSPSPTLHLPSQSHIRWYLLLYFDKFHPTFPFILQSHCQSHDAPVILLLAVSAIGSRYARSSAAAADRHLLSLALTNAMREKLWSYPDWSSSSLYSPDPVLLGEDVDIGDVAFVQAGLLLVLLELHSECRLRAERTAVDRLYLVNICKIRGLLKRKESVDANLSNEDSLRKWQLDQTRLRTGLMIWLLDTMMDYETAFGCQMLLSDANVDLPCHDEVWNNPTAESIREEGSKTGKSCLIALSRSADTQVTLLHALEILYIRKAFPPHLTSLGLLLLIQGIYRKTREVVAEARTLLSSWTPSPEPQAVALHSDHDETWPPSNPTLVKWRNSACDSLDILHWSENSKIATAGGFEAPNTLHLHLARLTILTPVNHLQSLARAPQHWKVNSTAASQSEISHTRVLQWAVRDQFKARLAVIHAGSIFWHIRRYSTQSMIEAFSVYLATLVIWAYSMTVNIMKSYDKPGEQSQASQTPLEAATHATMPSDTTDASQDEEEELELSFMNLDRPVDDEMVQNYARYGQKMTAFMFGVGDICAPGAPKKILTAGIRLLSVASGQSDGGANSSYDLGKIWGHERGYHQALETLMVSSQPV
ncbi:uncharacterized protein HMPREF1541_04258 [Cyphellophora europaea CBS 101466]|uniref:Xylanolytic transcriptional activator regulatory domain-containing protein n=1 Tax=Cyphellophora europaea (strain CBS 101466) TaxID=1220924 RepID=W2RW49_CYPE1|nr:uncharacterized protein HMPREF1541_04258 [Cyphellophora europaea CBS 101466]ETN39983.1 hypothetical protein HMPREF1541_04258 [Cyphellophora europaea CBS 101466]